MERKLHTFTKKGLQKPPTAKIKYFSDNAGYSFLKAIISVLIFCQLKTLSHLIPLSIFCRPPRIVMASKSSNASVVNILASALRWTELLDT